MTNKINAKLILELKASGLSRNQIAATRHMSKHSVSDVINIAREKVCGTKKREEILAELQTLNGGGGHDVHQQAKSRELLGKELGLTGRMWRGRSWMCGRCRRRSGRGS